MKARTLFGITAAGLSAIVLAGCGEVSRNGRSPVQVVITRFEAASGADPQRFGGTLNSDVITNVRRTVNGQQVDVPTIFSDPARVTMRLTLRDSGFGSATSPTLLNEVTFTRYRVEYERADGRNTPGVDVPYDFDSAATFTVPTSGEVSGTFELVRHTAKKEAPLMALASNNVLINTIARVTFYGQDQTGNEVSAVSSIGIVFGNFGDPGQ